MIRYLLGQVHEHSEGMYANVFVQEVSTCAVGISGA